VSAVGLAVRHHPAQVGVDDEDRLTARAGYFELRLQLRHQRDPPKPSSTPSRPPFSNFFVSSSGVPSGSVAVSRRSRICMRWKLKRWPKPAANVSSGTRKTPREGTDAASTRKYVFNRICTLRQSFDDWFVTVSMLPSSFSGSIGGLPHAAHRAPSTE